MRKLIIPLAILLVLAVYISKERNTMQVEMAAIQLKADSLYYEVIALKYQKQRYEFIYDQLSITNPEIIKAFNETE
jgi:membrane protein YdbS with pleckstrin-like domain